MKKAIFNVHAELKIKRDDKPNSLAFTLRIYDRTATTIIRKIVISKLHCLRKYMMTNRFLEIFSRILIRPYDFSLNIPRFPPTSW